MTKNNFLRLISTLIVINLIMLSFVFVQANDENSVFEAQDILPKIQVLKGLGIIDVSETSYQMTRAEFLYGVMVMRGYTDENIEQIELPYDDVLPDHKSAKTIKFAVDLGILDTNTKYFQPDDPVDLNFAIAVILNAMGYKEIINAGGGYPRGLMDIPVYKKLIADVTGVVSGILKYDQAIQILYNALGANIFVKTFYGDTMDIYHTEGKMSMMNKYMNIYRIKGKVMANHYTSIGGNFNCRSDEVIIDNKVYKVAETDISKMLGRYVECYYYVDDELPEIRNVVYYSIDSASNYIKIMYDNLVSFENGVYTYENEKGKISRAKVKDTMDIIYNGKVVESEHYNNSLMVPEYGFVELIADKDSNVFETVSITSSYNCVVDTISVNDRFCAITDRYDSSSNVIFSLNEDNVTYFIEDVNGNKLVLEDITKDAVLNIVKSIDGRLFNITVITNKVQGIVNSYTETEIVLDNDDYVFSETFATLFKNKQPIFVGNTAILYFDMYGKVVAAEPIEEIIEYGYLVFGVCKGSLASELRFRIFTQQGEFKNYNADEAIYIDGQKYKRAYYLNALKCFYNNGSFVPQIVKIGFTANNVIKRIDTISQGSKEGYDSLSIIPLTNALEVGTYGDIGRKYKTEVKFFDGGAFIKDDTTVFLIPQGRFAEEKDYSVTGRSYFEGDQFYDIEAYTTDKDSVFADVIVCKYYPKYSNDLQDRTEDGSAVRPFRSYISLPTAYVNSVNKVLDSNGEEAIQLDMISFTTHSDLNCIVRWEDELADIGPGSVVKYHIGINGKITFVEKIFDCDTRQLYAGAYINQNTANELYSIRTHKMLNERVIGTAYGNNPNVFFATWRMAYLDVISTRENVIKTATCDLTKQIPEGEQINFFDGNTFTYVYEYIPEKKKLVVTDVTSIIPYEADPVNYSKIAVISRGGTAINAVIILK